jgi:hypothetical protein
MLRSGEPSVNYSKHFRFKRLPEFHGDVTSADPLPVALDMHDVKKNPDR